MSPLIDQWKAQLGALSTSDRAELAAFLLSSLGREDEDVEASWDAEAARRVHEIRSGKRIGRPIDEVIAELRDRRP